MEFDPVELRLADHLHETGRMKGFFGAIRDSMPDYCGRLLVENTPGKPASKKFDYP